MTITLYGIKNCDTVKKARLWLDQHQVPYRFHDFRADGIARDELATWLAELGSDVLINRRGTTWRQLDDAQKATADQDAATLLAELPTLIKRPVLDLGDRRVVGFQTARYAELFDGSLP
ncbi:MAG: ArsC family reductase [Spongiibacteraceae bacterium]|nr:ArsC family reductase [Spongiibacteraceae bacterium]